MRWHGVTLVTREVVAAPCCSSSSKPLFYDTYVSASSATLLVRGRSGNGVCVHSNVLRLALEVSVHEVLSPDLGALSYWHQTLLSISHGIDVLNLSHNSCLCAALAVSLQILFSLLSLATHAYNGWVAKTWWEHLALNCWYLICLHFYRDVMFAKVTQEHTVRQVA